MCCLYGFLHYGDNKINDLKEITNSLSKEAAQRGTDSTGIAFNDSGRLKHYQRRKVCLQNGF